MNRAAVSRTISKQESVFLLSALPLTLCSEHIEIISTSRHRKQNNLLEENHESCKKMTWMEKYENRIGRQDENFHDFVYTELNFKKGKRKTVIPHFSGALQICPIPLTEAYAYQALTVFKPWNLHNQIYNKKMNHMFQF